MPTIEVGGILAGFLKRFRLARAPAAPVRKRSIYTHYDEFSEQTQIDRATDVAESAIQAQKNEAWIYACVRAIATSAAGLPMRIYRQIPMRDGTVEREEVFDPAVEAFFKRPNPDSSWSDIIEASISHAEMSGTFYWERVLNQDGTLAAIYPVRPDWIEPIPDEKRRIEGWLYTGGSGEDVHIPRDNIFQFRYFNPESELVGLAPFVASIRATVRDMHAQAYDENFFKNNGRPGIALSTDQSISEEDQRALREQWRHQHQGTEKAHLPAVLVNGLKIQEFGSQPDMAFAELRKMNRTEILAAFGVPSVVVGVLDDASYANAKEQKQTFWRMTMAHKLKKFEEFVDRTILPFFGAGLYAEFNRDEIVDLQEDATAKATRVATLITSGVSTINEVRRDEYNKPEVEWGDTWWQPLSVVPAGSSAPSPLAPQPAPESEPEEAPDPDDTEPAGAAPASGAPAVLSVARRVAYSPARRQAVSKRFRADVEDQARPMQRRLEEFLSNLADREVRRFRNIVKVGPGADVVAMMYGEASEDRVEKVTADDIRDLENILKSFGFENVRRSGTAAARELGGRFTIGPNIEQVIQATAADRAGKIASDVRRAISDVISKALQETPEPTASEVAQRLRESAAFSVGRAERIARTETTLAANYGITEGYKASGITEHEWLTITDGSERDTHHALDGSVAKVGDYFVDRRGNVTALKFPGDPGAPVGEVVNCRCTTAPVVSVEKYKGRRVPSGFVERDVTFHVEHSNGSGVLN